MMDSAFRPALGFRLLSLVFALLLVASPSLARAASIRGMVSNTAGERLAGVQVTLIRKGAVVGSAITSVDGSFEILTGNEGRFFLLIAGKGVRQLETPDFYAGRLDSMERNLVVEPEWVRDAMVVAATGVPTPDPQSGESMSELGQQDLRLREDLIRVLRTVPGSFVVQQGQRGAAASLLLRGGAPAGSKIELDGVSVGDLGGAFDFASFSTTALQSAEVDRGPAFILNGAESGVVSLTTPHGTTSFPSVLFEGDAGNFSTSREDLELAGTRLKLDYLGAFGWMQTANELPLDEFHLATTAANVGWQPGGNTQIRATVHYGVDGSGVPGAVDFFGASNDATHKDQDLYLSASIHLQTTADFHNSLRYGLSRKREEQTEWALPGSLVHAYDPVCYASGYFGNPVRITGANGYSVNGRAMSGCAESYLQSTMQQVANRDQFTYQGDYRITPHLTALAGFHYEEERGANPGSTYYLPVERTSQAYLLGVHGDFKERFFYTLGGSLQKYSLFGTQLSPHAGVSFQAVRSQRRILSGTRLIFDFGSALREPELADQHNSLDSFLHDHGEESVSEQLHLSPLAAPATRAYEGGVEQAFFSERIVLRSTYFHNETGREVEYVGLRFLPQLLPDLSSTEQQVLWSELASNGASGLMLNAEAVRAEGIETSIESGIGKNIFLRGGYTYLDAVVQHAFSSESAVLLGPAPISNGLPVGADAPLVGARPFRRPPHTGFFAATYSRQRIAAELSSSFASRSDDSDFLGGDALNGGDSLLLPNRNLDPGYATIDLGASYQLFYWLSIFAQGENLTSNTHLAPIGYRSLPVNVRTGLRMEWGKGARH